MTSSIKLHPIMQSIIHGLNAKQTLPAKWHPMEYRDSAGNVIGEVEYDEGPWADHEYDDGPKWIARVIRDYRIEHSGFMSKCFEGTGEGFVEAMNWVERSRGNK